MPSASLQSIHEFLDVARIAIAGASRSAADYSRLVMKEFQRCGYTVIPVNPAASEIGGERCYARITEIDPKPDAVVLLVPDKQIVEATQQCIQAGIRHVWFRRPQNESSAYHDAIGDARAAKMNVVAGECPIMFLPGTSWIHRAHRFLRKTAGTYPVLEPTPRQQ
ncbi:MAG: CoA-binding protein [Bryobacterales bacterium]|nr:CoA-binding protein [Bryobacterales bacterium]